MLHFGGIIIGVFRYSFTGWECESFVSRTYVTPCISLVMARARHFCRRNSEQRQLVESEKSRSLTYSNPWHSSFLAPRWDSPNWATSISAFGTRKWYFSSSSARKKSEMLV